MFAVLSAGASSVQFYMYTDRALDHRWLAECPGFARLTRSAQNERLGEVYASRLLATHSARTYDPSAASLFYVPIWDVASFVLGACNGSGHSDRMAAAAAALRSSPQFAARSGRAAGWDHFFLSTGCIEGLGRKTPRARLGHPLAKLLSAAISFRDRAYSPFYRNSAVGRCVVEAPYVSNPHSAAALAARRAAPRPRRWLLAFAGSLEVCCNPGLRTRQAARALVGANGTQIVHVGRTGGWPGEEQRALLASGAAGGWPGSSDAAQLALFRSAGELLADSTFCLVPAGDNEVLQALGAHPIAAHATAPMEPPM